MSERNTPKKDARITIRLTREQAAELQAAAGRRDRTTNWLSRHILATWLSRERKRRGQ